MPKKIEVPLDEIREMYLAGMNTYQIAEKFDVSPDLIQKRIRKMGIMRSNSEAKKMAYRTGSQEPTTYWTGKKQPAGMVEARAKKVRGENHYLWKGGKDRRKYRQKVKKVKCDLCGSRLNLAIHHRDFDHYNDNPDNLQVLCVSCHQSLHKQAYWDAIKNGEEPPKSNGPVGWER